MQTLAPFGLVQENIVLVKPVHGLNKVGDNNSINYDYVDFR